MANYYATTRSCSLSASHPELVEVPAGDWEKKTWDEQPADQETKRVWGLNLNLDLQAGERATERLPTLVLKPPPEEVDWFEAIEALNKGDALTVVEYCASASQLLRRLAALPGNDELQTDVALTPALAQHAGYETWEGNHLQVRWAIAHRCGSGIASFLRDHAGFLVRLAPILGSTNLREWHVACKRKGRGRRSVAADDGQAIQEEALCIGRHCYAAVAHIRQLARLHDPHQTELDASSGEHDLNPFANGEPFSGRGAGADITSFLMHHAGVLDRLAAALKPVDPKQWHLVFVRKSRGRRSDPVRDMFKDSAALLNLRVETRRARGKQDSAIKALEGRISRAELFRAKKRHADRPRNPGKSWYLNAWGPPSKTARRPHLIWNISWDSTITDKSRPHRYKLQIDRNWQKDLSMGMDVYGKAPISGYGKYFRNQVWFWHPLAEICKLAAPEITGRCKNWHNNDGAGLDRNCAIKLAKKLDKLRKDGTINTMCRELLLEWRFATCPICLGSGVMKVTKTNIQEYHTKIDREMAAEAIKETMIAVTINDEREGHLEPCECCHGVGLLNPASTPHYRASEDNVREFAAFCRDSGGFEIW
jgi:hypothetical protein